MEPKSVVALFLRDGEHGKEVLAISRKGKPEDLGIVGGKREDHETPLETLVRETREEVGVEVVQCQFVFERIDPVDGWVAWCYLIDSYEGDPHVCESDTWVGWVPARRLIEEGCTFREYNRGLLLHMQLLGA